jgi:uncharacterized membrane-anchored protein YhcB (DUF1043 family)
LSEESISVLGFLPELLGVLVGTVIGYLIANRASKLASKKSLNQTKIALIAEIEHNKKALKSWNERISSSSHPISAPFRISAYQTSIASGNFAKLHYHLQHALGELYHEIDAFQSFANIIVNWHYATIAINPQGQENYEKFLGNLADSSEFVQFEKKMVELLNKAQEQLKSK